MHYKFVTPELNHPAAEKDGDRPATLSKETQLHDPSKQGKIHGLKSIKRLQSSGGSTLWRNPTSDIFPSISDPCKIAKKKAPLIQKFFRSIIAGSSVQKFRGEITCDVGTDDSDQESEDPRDKFKKLFNNRRKGVRLYQRSRTIHCKKLPLQTLNNQSNQLSEVSQPNDDANSPIFRAQLTRRYSHDELISLNREYLVDVQSTLENLIMQEDTDGDYRITVLDKGPKSFLLGSLASNGYKKYEIRGTYNISNLLQELALASELKYHVIILSQEHLDENPLNRLDRVIREVFWRNLTRCLDFSNLETIIHDPKFPDCNNPIIYVPFDDDLAFDYYSSAANSTSNKRINVVRLPKVITPEFVRDINCHPGILSLKVKCVKDFATGEVKLQPCKYVVPGGRFNEMYGWDSYFIVLGLLEDGFFELAVDMLENLCYEIERYGKILNANRSYYLCRSQPPLLTDMINKISAALISNSDEMEANLKLIYKGYRAALKEFFGIWFSRPRYIPSTGLSRYCPQGIGVPPETEPSHFTHLLEPHAKKHGLKFKEFVHKYTVGEFADAELDDYFLNDRAVRESGHDTTYRFENRCANLNNIDLNCLLYRYESDIERFIKNDPRGYLKINIRRGVDDVFLKSFTKFTNDLNKNPLEEVLTRDDGLETTWTNGIYVEDEELDEFNIAAFDVVDNTRPNEVFCSNDYHPLQEQCNSFKNSPNRGVANGPNEKLRNYGDTARSTNGDKSSGPASPNSGTNFEKADIVAPMWQLKTKSKTRSDIFEVRFYPALFEKLAEFTKSRVNKYLWNEEKSLFFDYNFKLQEQINYETVTTFWALWSGLATKAQAEKMVPIALKKFEVAGGLVSGTAQGCRDALKLDKPSRQWDYPYGWSPHQVMAWMGLSDYGYEEDARRLAYRWVYLITKSFFDFNGVVPEKYDIVKMTHILNVEYGNVGSDFTYVVKGGFGWMNASFKLGLNYLPIYMRLRLGVLTHPDECFYNMQVKFAPMCCTIPPT